MAVRTRMTASEYMELPETMQPMMLIDGEIIVSPSATDPHQALVIQLIKFLLNSTTNGTIRCAPLDVHFDEFNVTQPDVLWIAPGGKCHLTANGKFLEGAPDFIAEIASPGTARYDRKEKFALYEKYGVRQYWMLDSTDKLIEVWSLQDGHFVRVGIFGAGEGFTSPLFGAIVSNATFADEKSE